MPLPRRSRLHFSATRCSVYTTLNNVPVGTVAQSVKQLATVWTIRGSNPGGGEIFRTCPDRLWGPPSLLYNGYRVFPGLKSGRGVTLTPHPLLVPWPRKSRALPLIPYGPYGLYTASVPAQGHTLPYTCTEHKAIILSLKSKIIPLDN